MAAEDELVGAVAFLLDVLQEIRFDLLGRWRIIASRPICLQDMISKSRE